MALQALVEPQDLLPGMHDWNLKHLAWRPHHPEILSSTEEGRAIVLDLSAGEILQDHQVHEGAWITVVEGEIRITSHTGQTIDAEPGVLVRRSIPARSASASVFCAACGGRSRACG